MEQELSVVGKRLPRLETVGCATGAAKYAVDIRLPGMLTGRVLRSPYPHAQILRVDTSKAEKLAGVEVIITNEDVPRKLFNGTFTALSQAKPAAAAEVRDRYIFCDKARYIGDEIAAVAAVNESIAEEALRLIEVEYEELQAVFEPIEAMKSDAPRIHNFADHNIARHIPYIHASGDVDKGFQEADCIVKETFYTSKQKHCQLEPTTTIASFDMAGRLTVWTQCNRPHLCRRKIADIFDIPVGMVKVITPYVGGSFGGRSNFNGELICIALAQKASKPVKLEYTREEDFIVHMSRQPFIQTGEIGARKDGTITALQTKLIAHGGAYFETSGSTTNFNMVCFTGLYRCPNIAAEADIIYSNTPSSGGMRGYGNPQAMFVLEQIIDMLAEKIGMDPVEFRSKNYRRAGEPRHGTTVLIESCPLDKCIRLGAARIGWKEERARKKEGVRRQGVGMAIMGHSSGAYPTLLEHSNAFIKLNEDGSANLVVSPLEQGQGILCTLTQIAAEELGVRAEDIHIVTGDTDVTMFDMGSYASRSLYVIGNAVLRATREAKGKLLERAAKALGVTTEKLEIKDRRVYVRSAPEKGISVAEVARDSIYNFEGECLNISGKCSFEATSSADSYQAAFVKVEVDTETGEVKLIKIVIVHDIGRAINPMIVEGQLEGGLVQGIGYSLIEDYVINKDTGVIESDSFASYRIPSILDLPETEVILVEQPVPSGPFGAKCVGEPGMVAIAPAIANAIYNAVGIRVKELPITPEKILKAIKEKG